jgi:hypothetical protein
LSTCLAFKPPKGRGPLAPICEKLVSLSLSGSGVGVAPVLTCITLCAIILMKVGEKNRSLSPSPGPIHLALTTLRTHTRCHKLADISSHRCSRHPHYYGTAFFPPCHYIDLAVRFLGPGPFTTQSPIFVYHYTSTEDWMEVNEKAEYPFLGHCWDCRFIRDANSFQFGR